ncbi:unnamed protein product [Albugo candida]|uniref:ShKT domain-containing protein n=1 Tax=Albugo candida TaxID=65357 RepID=A0A024G207_9STRA|nr:unnamed protein product [Albugo candida]|eukprot:CCI40338.1 unnamed protein product [Albugo candida]
MSFYVGNLTLIHALARALARVFCTDSADVERRVLSTRPRFGCSFLCFTLCYKMIASDPHWVCGYWHSSFCVENSEKMQICSMRCYYPQ